MIGIFDSGSGGLSTLYAFQKVLPQYDYLYFGDYLNCPYGDKTAEQIYDLSEAGVRRLFDAGATIVIMACNTAITHAIKKLQSEIFPDKKILGVTITGGEKAVEKGYTHITVLATAGSVGSGSFRERLHIFDSDTRIDEIALPGLVEIIEEYFDQENPGITPRGKSVVHAFLTQELVNVSPDSQAIVIGCTHYSWIKDILADMFPDKEIIDASYEAAQKFVGYLERHPDLEQNLSRGGTLQYL